MPDDSERHDEIQQTPQPGQSASGHAYRALQELGLVSLYHSPPDIKLLCAQRFVRMFAYGASTLIIVPLLQDLGFSKTRIGLFMTLTLAGDVFISLFLTAFADSLGRKFILGVGAALMGASGLAFAACRNYWLLLAAAVFGVISPSGYEIGPFRAVEESVVAHLTSPATRADIYAWYTLLGSTGTALGFAISGSAIRSFTESWQWEPITAYRAIFVGYTICGVFKFILALQLSSAVEADKKATDVKPTQQSAPETRPLLGQVDESNNVETETINVAASKSPQRKSSFATFLPRISPESQSTVLSIILLFSIDSFCSGLVTLSWVTHFFRSKFSINDETLGFIFSVTSIVSAASMLLASAMAKRFGNINTMVFTHLPSDVFLSLIPASDSVYVSLVFLFLRDSMKSMDTAPRSAFVAAMLLPAERTAAMGLINVGKTAAQSLGPVVTGILADNGLFWVSFVCAGAGKMLYDLGLLVVFKSHRRIKTSDHS
ncbi:major facilitator superfamily domain-containing protein [Xylariales sp. PMI_506]|nr:major facilitator superfamily domain-containing protein [Xylariales sp. PMI_506]